jgi:hypothetical protein
MAEDTAGDPCSLLKWKHKSLRRLSAALGKAHPASPPTVRRLLDALDYSRKVNHKALAGSGPDRNEQFEYLQAQKQAFVAHGWPVIYVDTKKRELIGLFKNAGTIWCRDPHRVNIYDFRSLAAGIAIPYGLYDAQRNAGFVYVGGHRRICGGCPSVVVANGRSPGLPQRLGGVDLGRWRREQWLSPTLVEVCLATSPGESHWPERDGLPLSNRSVEMKLG